MQITQNLRKEIVYVLRKLSLKDADKIAAKCNVHRDTVYRQYRKLKGEDPIEDNDVIIALARLAASRKKQVVNSQNELRTIEKQLSEIK